MNSVFDSLSKSQINKLFDLLGVHIYKYNKYDEIIPTIKNENIIGIIMSGSANIINVEYNGDEIVKETLYTNSVFGTNISATNSEDYQIIAKENCEVLIIDYNNLINPNNFKYSYFNLFFRNLFVVTNEKYKITNERVRIIEKKQIRDRLLEFFEIEHKKTRSKSINLPFSFKDLADYLAINRSAMFRELRHLKDDSFIEVKGRRITLLYKNKLL